MTPEFFAATVPDVVTFVICAVVVLAGGVGVVTSRNAVHAALSLVMTLFGVAVLFIEQDAQFLAAVQVIVYAGAIVVLFLFVIMFLGVDSKEDLRFEPLRGQRPLSLLMVAVALVGVLALAATANWTTGAHHVAGSTGAGGHTDTYLLGQSVFTTYLWPFEITAGLLVIAVVGAVVLARRPSDVDDVVDEPSPVAGDGPGGSPAEAVALDRQTREGGDGETTGRGATASGEGPPAPEEAGVGAPAGLTRTTGGEDQ